MAMKTRRTAEQDERFFHILRHGAPVTVAAKAAGSKPNTLYRWRKLDPAFAARWRAVEREKASALDKTYRQVLEQLVRRGLHVPAEKQAGISARLPTERMVRARLLVSCRRPPAASAPTLRR